MHCKYTNLHIRNKENNFRIYKNYAEKNKISSLDECGRELLTFSLSFITTFKKLDFTHRGKKINQPLFLFFQNA